MTPHHHSLRKLFSGEGESASDHQSAQPSPQPYIDTPIRHGHGPSSPTSLKPRHASTPPALRSCPQASA